ncbi:hypothetical protein BJV78DRAFT_1280122 [Lactifluus subvellereus]|nr:hypothetical protein BJV78DRAFT_1280122 [Lactifluus subvellereus]
MSEQVLPTASHPGAPLSLLSLSIAASHAKPIEVSQDSSLDVDDHHPWRGGAVEGTQPLRNPNQGVAVHNGTKHRRLSSTGQARRRLSDARDAASRPSPVALQTAAAALGSIASLSTSPSVPLPGPDVSASPRAPTGPVAIPALRASRHGISRSVPVDDGSSVSGSPPPPADSKAMVTGALMKNGKKRGTIFTCESCSKVYRHPSCLIKHRWEHTPHWREASKFLLSKHQQVQLMEAAAILSHLTPSASGGSSLPDDRSLWPSFLSGGALPPPLPVGETGAETAAHPTSSSVPSGPRIHDYALPNTSVSGITRLRPGIIAVPTEPVPYTRPEIGAPQSYTTGYGSIGIDSSSFASSYQSSAGVIVPHARASGSSDRWSLSLSRSGSSDESEFVEVETETTPSGGFGMGGLHLGDEGDISVKEEEEEEGGWDGMEMEMEL